MLSSAYNIILGNSRRLEKNVYNRFCILFLLSRQLYSQIWLFTSIDFNIKNPIKHSGFYPKINQASSQHETPSLDPPYVVNDKTRAISLSCCSLKGKKKKSELCTIRFKYWSSEGAVEKQFCQTWVIFV